MTETLSQKRFRFSFAISRLIDWANGEGIDVAIDQVKRTQAEANANAASGAGISNSLHLIGLAADLLIYIDGQYQTDGPRYERLGRYWKTLGVDHAWGGDFTKRDPGHYSISHEGRK